MYIFLYHHFIGKESEPQRQAVTCPGKHSKYNLYPEIELKSLPQRPFSSLKSQCQFSKLLLDSRIVILGIWALRSYWFIYLNLASFQNCLWDLEEAWTVTQSSTHNKVPLSSRSVCCHFSKKLWNLHSYRHRKRGACIAERDSWECHPNFLPFTLWVQQNKSRFSSNSPCVVLTCDHWQITGLSEPLLSSDKREIIPPASLDGGED